MRKLDDVKYLLNLSEAKPDSNSYIRFATEYLSQINESSFQTEAGVIKLTSPYTGDKLQHNDKILFMGRILQKN